MVKDAEKEAKVCQEMNECTEQELCVWKARCKVLKEDLADSREDLKLALLEQERYTNEGEKKGALEGTNIRFLPKCDSNNLFVVMF